MLVPLSEDEEAKLEGSLMLRGCLSPLIVDSYTGVLVDGHNRYRICKANNIPFEIKEVDIGKKKNLKQFILINQLGRRNIDSTQRKKLVAELMDLVKVRSEDQPGFKEGHEFKGNQHATDQKVVVYQNDTQPKQPKTAAEKVSGMTGVSPATANRWQKEVKEWKEHGLMDDINSGKLKDKEANKIIKEKKQKAEVKEIIEDSKPLRKQTKAEAKEEEDVLKENPHLRDPGGGNGGCCDCL
jgi:hypothetical protein